MSNPAAVSCPAALRLPMACDFRNVRGVAQAAHHFLLEHGCDEDTLMACELALVEGCNNAIKYAPAAGRLEPVWLEVLCDPAQVELRITDHTAGFDWPEHATLPDPSSESGRGICLMQSLMDRTQYLRGADENVLVLRKRRPTDAPARVETRDREIERGIQQSLLLREIPQLPGFELAGFCRSAQEVGGDFYDVWKTGERSLLMIVADVMGKGILPAMFAAILRNALRAMRDLADDPAMLLTRANRLMFEELSGADLFITAQVVHFDAATRRLTVANAGHCPMLIADGSGERARAVSPDGMPLGISPDTAFESEVVEFPERSRVLLYTDGLTEAVNVGGDPCGPEPLQEWWARVGTRGGARELKRELVEMLEEFRTKSVLNDDQTFLIMTG